MLLVTVVIDNYYWVYTATYNRALVLILLLKFLFFDAERCGSSKVKRMLV